MDQKNTGFVTKEQYDRVSLRTYLKASSYILINSGSNKIQVILWLKLHGPTMLADRPIFW